MKTFLVLALILINVQAFAEPLSLWVRKDFRVDDSLFMGSSSSSCELQVKGSLKFQQNLKLHVFGISKNQTYKNFILIDGVALIKCGAETTEEEMKSAVKDFFSPLPPDQRQNEVQP